MKTCFETGGPNPYPGAKTASLITLEQSESGKQLFRVTYGLHVDNGLTYAEAAKALGECILHHLCCESLVSNEGE